MGFQLKKLRTIAVLLVCSSIAFAQAAKPASPAAKKPATAATSSAAPTRATVDAFMKAWFGWRKTAQWTINSIKPLGNTHVTDLSMMLGESPSTLQELHIYVFPGNKLAIAGVPAQPFEPGVSPKVANGRPTSQAAVAYVKKLLPNAPGEMTADVQPSKIPGVAEARIAIQSPQGPQSGVIYIMDDGSYAFRGDIIPFGADPFAAARAKLTKADGPAHGPADAPVKLVEFSDLECPACKAAQPIIDRIMQEVPGVRVVFQNFPLETMHPWALKAATYADCVGRESHDAFWKFVHSVYANQGAITLSNADDKLMPLAIQAGAPKDKLTSCIADPKTHERIYTSQALGKELDVNATPTVFVNGRKVQNVYSLGFDGLKAMVEAAKTHPQPAAVAKKK